MNRKNKAFMLFQNCNDESRIIPLFGLPSDMTIIIFGFLLPLVLSIILSIIFAKLIAPLFLKLKNKLLASKYKDGYISIERDKNQKRLTLPRLIQLILLVLGIHTSIYSSLDPNQWLSPEDICSYAERGIENYFNMTMFLTLFGLLVPLGIAIWSISWAIEDAGLMHYSLKKDSFYEIEPVHIKFNSYLKGFAGISSIIFVITFITKIVQATNYISDGFLILVAFLMAIFCFIPTYIIYIKVVNPENYMRTGLEEIKILSENDIK